MTSRTHYVFKFIVIGESGVGKTCLVNAYAGNGFITSHISTVGIDFMIKKFKRDSKEIKLQLWDTAGQEQYRSISSEYMRGAHGIVIVYDVSDLKTLDKSIEIYNDIAVAHDNLQPVITLIGTKYDKIDEIFKSEKKFADDMMEQVSLGVDKIKINHFSWDPNEPVPSIKFFLTSAKTGHGIEELFDYMVDKVLLNEKALVGRIWYPKPLVSTTDPIILSLKEDIAQRQAEIKKERLRQQESSVVLLTLENTHTDNTKKESKCC